MDLFKETYEYWCEVTTKMKKDYGDRIDYQFFKKIDKEVQIYENDLSILNGISGVGLIINSIVNNSEPTWDRFFLLSY